MKGQFRTQRHCPPTDLPDHFKVLIDDMVYIFARHISQPEGKVDNQVLYNVFIEDGLINSQSSTGSASK